MQYFSKKKIGRQIYTFVSEGNNLYECIMESQKLSFGDIDKCGKCPSDNLILNARFAQKQYKYVEVKCLSCKAALVFGCTKQDPNTFYLRRNKKTKQYDWKEYNPDQPDLIVPDADNGEEE